MLCCRGTGGPLKAEEETRGTGPDKSVIRVNVTRQGYHFRRPWRRKAPSRGTAIGVILKGPRVLVTSSLLSNHRHIELEKVDSGVKSGAVIEWVDYEANLALLRPRDKDFLNGMHPLEIATDTVQGDRLAVWQVQPNGNVHPGVGPVTSIEVERYPHGDYFLTYRMNSSLQYRFSNSTLPVVKDGKLAGLLLRYRAKAQTLDVIAAPVIEHFLKDGADGAYGGFPKAGIRLVSTEDPQLRRYVGLPEKAGGVYLQGVIRGGPAEKAGLRAGDVITELARFPIDRRGNYRHPLYGKVSLAHLIRCEGQAGDTIAVKIFRDGRAMTLEMVPEHRSSRDHLVPPYVIDESPRYYVLGGLVLQELTTPYLRSYGKSWQFRAPNNFVYYEKNQDFLDMGPQEKIVFLSEVLPSSFTSGYERMRDLVVTRINGHVIGRLEDVDSALETPVDGFHKVEFRQFPMAVYLDPQEIPLIDRQIIERYRLPALKNLE